jgi:TPR repeat protein
MHAAPKEHWGQTMARGLKNGNFVIESRLAAAARGDDRAYYELGMVYSTGASGVGVDLIEAHKWFNLAAVAGNVAAQHCRAEIAEDMTARQISVAQRAARDWLGMTQRRAA